MLVFKKDKIKQSYAVDRWGKRRRGHHLPKHQKLHLLHSRVLTHRAVVHVSSSKLNVATVSSLNIESTVSNFPNAKTDTTKSDKMLMEEVQSLFDLRNI